ncbi:hypothetical protein ISS96_02800 [Candidatus Bathyarchaeota archaeon]|nr:hypothetical protein [Candidatus Bathyarchaeota archaeon]
MQRKVTGNWLSYRRRGIFGWIKEKISSPTPPSLRQRIADARYRLRLQSAKLGANVSRLTGREKMMFNKCVKAKMMKDTVRATMYANECAEIRKATRVLIRSQLALEQVSVRLETVDDLGNVLVNMAPVVGVIRETSGSLTGIMPEISSELGEVNKMLNETIFEAGDIPTRELGFEASEEAQRIIQEANLVAEQKMRDRFPELPTSLPVVPQDLPNTT